MILRLNNKIILLYLLVSFALYNYGQITPADKQLEGVLLYGATLHIGDGKVIKKAAIGFQNGIIDKVIDLEKENFDSLNYKIIKNVSGQEIYPGFIAMNSTIGLMEIGAVRATKDFRETGKFNPNSRTLTSFNTDSRITPTVRSNGILLGQISPRGGVISGTSSVMSFDGWNWEDAVVRADEGIHMNWPRSRVNQNSNNELDIKKAKTKILNNINEIYTFFESAEAYNKGNYVVKDLKMEAMKQIFRGGKRLYIHASEVSQIKEIIAFKNEFKIEKITLVGAKDAHYIAEVIAENKISVLINRVHSLPNYRQSELDISYRLPAILFKAGVLFCFENQGDMEQMQTRNLPFLAGTAVAYGLPYEEAVKALTFNCAKILEINDYGVLKVGKSATLFVSEGDALNIMYNKLTSAYIDGRELNLSNDQVKNYEKYCKKYSLIPQP